jgi:hypothetical protein
MSTIAAGRSRTGSAGLVAARVVRLITALVVGLIVVGIVLVVLDANASNGLVKALLDAARWLVGPFKGIFSLDSHKATVAVNWGLAAVVYGAVGTLIARLLAR